MLLLLAGEIAIYISLLLSVLSGQEITMYRDFPGGPVVDSTLPL